MKQLLLFSVLFVASSAALFGSHKCTYGPSYWCSSIVKAKECNAVKHCIQTWEKVIMPEDNDDICQICKDMVKEARDTLLSNETQEELREVLEGSCKLIPIEAISKVCMELSDDLIPELIETLASQMDPQVVCATSGLCNSPKVDKLLKMYYLEHPNINKVPQTTGKIQPSQPGDCTDCEGFINDVIKNVKDQSRSETLNIFMAVCGRLGSLSDACMALVEANFDDIVHFLTEQLQAKDFCTLCGMCDKGKQTNKLPRSGDEGCDFCVVIVKHWRDLLTANTTEIEFKEILEGLCKQSGSFSPECLGLVDQYYEPLYNLLVSEIHPTEICEAVGLCGDNSVFGSEQVPIWTLHNLRPQDTLPVQMEITKHGRMFGQDEAASYALRNKASQSLPRVTLTKTKPNVQIVSAGYKGVVGSNNGKGHVQGDDMCVMCEFALHFLQNVLHENDTREEIKEAVDNLCAMMPHTVAEECQDYVDAYGDQVIDMLAYNIDPSVICPAIGLCPSKVVGMITKNVDTDVPCVMCEYAMNQLEDMLKDKKNEEEIRKALDNLCQDMPKSIRSECTQFVDTYSELVIQLLIADLNPDQVCEQLGLCKTPGNKLQQLTSVNQLPISRLFVPAIPNHGNSISSLQSYDVTTLKQSTVCVLCELVMVNVDQILLQNSTKNEIETTVEFICAHLPGTVQEDCIGFVEEYGDAMIKLIATQLKPGMVCKELSLCKPSAMSNMKVALVNLDLDVCSVCEEVIRFVDDKLETEAAKAEIDSLFENVCTLLPNSAQKDCRSIIEVYGPYLINMLEELGHDNKRVCQVFDLCPKNVNTNLLGAKKCSWGPGYWCQTQLHAMACKATDHCEKNVWRGIKPTI